ncbi:UbiE/COQ5 methyltransferase [mine drainage metagenome]|uniref:UbiE/COQ5 methyltransferase n=1 Tax=mine drainage metagenome TaxID=410659 RepID=T1C741_9ZZZZ
MTRKDNDSLTDFGFEAVPFEEKTRRVRAVFDSVADRYDLMNDLMSVGLHRFWKRFLGTLARPTRPHPSLLDLASGTGDLLSVLDRVIPDPACRIASDINYEMLCRGRAKLSGRSRFRDVFWIEANAEQLPFADRTFDLVTMAFGLRNVTDKEAVLTEIHRVLRPGGVVLILEFSHPKNASFRKLYDRYSFEVLPRLGRWVARDEASYRYLAESIRRHPDPPTLKRMMEEAGLARVDYFNLSLGIVALHRGYRL